jgi:hypothetical protein
MDTKSQTIWLQSQFAPESLPDKLYVNQNWLSIMSLPNNGAHRNTYWTYTYRKRFLVRGAVVHWWINWRSIDWNKGSHHVKHCIVALIRDTRMYKPTTLDTIAAWHNMLKNK